MAKTITKNILKDFGTIGDTEANKVTHLTLIEWGDYKAKYDIRAWDSEMDKCGKGITFSKNDLIELRDLLNSIDFSKE